MSYLKPPKISKSALNKIGTKIRTGSLDFDALYLFEYWRASHAYVINTFQARLRQKAKPYYAVVATRLKRKSTIFDKLKREPEMSLARMHDIAGCRIIFDSIDNLNEFRADMLSTRAKHELVSTDERYNYILNPKKSGYRGIHDVYKYRSYSETGLAWNGLQIEIQYRTLAQHSWATAVEAFDLAAGKRTKFSDANENLLHWFSLSSEIIARGIEKAVGPNPNIETAHLIQEYKESESRLQIMQFLKNLPIYNSTGSELNANAILVYSYDRLANGKPPLEIVHYDTWSSGIQKYFALEKEHGESADIVLVRGGSLLSIKSAFRNYFLDVAEFIDYVELALHNLGNELNYSLLI